MRFPPKLHWHRSDQEARKQLKKSWHKKTGWPLPCVHTVWSAPDQWSSRLVFDECNLFMKGHFLHCCLSLIALLFHWFRGNLGEASATRGKGPMHFSRTATMKGVTPEAKKFYDANTEYSLTGFIKLNCIGGWQCGISGACGTGTSVVKVFNFIRQVRSKGQ